ncbi:RagB/SusD family nutrient uptake outer membrane protein [Flavimarina sp. Hel_I_48]|uniref:RagB/SusD family nutrient uptake outer membrane protein n=1 Tax=Flavimarina sp. Hel_I_48 TaxID=1392488 RepID=UPI0013DCB6BC|nr:RagB/SusD family nutrient uptake outer membrane protein [Flavimarina sp. Hel_I_48]
MLGICLAEMYLISAESNFRLNGDVGAASLDDINVLRERAGVENAGSIYLAAILLERKGHGF